ncbi:MAG TPA: DUF2795 domain-containing protein [Gaiellaceae bacterium]|nr:DUF2795 domain-containing protein [Gaiellaceae bacterium]
MDTSRAAELQVLLEGVPLPATKDQLLEYAVQQRAEPHFLEALRSLPDREYASLDEVGEQLVHVQPPGGHADANPDPDTGRLRDAG